MYDAGKARPSTDKSAERGFTQGSAQESAQDLAITALAWLAEDAERLQRFLALSGLGPQNLRRAAAEPGFLGAVLDHLAGDETLLIAFANHANCAPEAVVAARRRLDAREIRDEP